MNWSNVTVGMAFMLTLTYWARYKRLALFLSALSGQETIVGSRSASGPGGLPIAAKSPSDEEEPSNETEPSSNQGELPSGNNAKGELPSGNDSLLPEIEGIGQDIA
jgi:hypothetical protein